MSLVSDLLTAIGYGLNRTIDVNSEPTETECISWINSTIDWILQTLAELGSDLGRTTGTITTTAGIASYSDLAADIYCPCVMVNTGGEDFCGWIEKTNSREPLTLETEARIIEYDSGDTQEPESFYIDGSNNVVFLQTPDDAYTIKIPYYQTQSVSAAGDTVPLLGLFDNLIIESIVTKYLYRTREDAGIEWNWFSFLKKRTERIAKLRKRTAVRIS